MDGKFDNRTVDLLKVWELVEGSGLSFEDLLSMSDYKCKDHTVDVVVELYVKGTFEGIVLVKRDREPYRGSWALPGGHINFDEVDPSGKYLPTPYAAIREIKEETALDVSGLAYLDRYNNWGRDTSLQRVNTAFVGQSYVDSVSEVVAGDDAVEVMIVGYGEVPSDLAFDHNQIIDYAKRISCNANFRVI